MIPRKSLLELLGMQLYQSGRGEFFYAWTNKHAFKRRPKELIYFITNAGHRILINKN